MDDVEEIATLQRRWMQAWVERDAATLHEILAPEFKLRSMATDTPLTRDRWLEDALSGRVAATEVRYDEMDVVVMGDTAVVDSLVTFEATIDGKDWSKTTYTTDVWTRRDGQWQVVRRHASAPVGRGGAMQA
jgi:ketosteroid isomerase-like protein